MDNLTYIFGSAISITAKTIQQKHGVEDRFIKTNKLILSVVTSSLMSTGIVNVQIINPEKNSIDTPNVEMESVSLFSAETKLSNQNFTNTQNKDDIIKMNNDKLEVDDLADKVTQAQLNEIKDHFDTKLNSMQKQLSTQIDQAKTATINEIKQTISSENKELKKAKVSKARFLIGSVLVPFIVAGLTLFFSQFINK